MTAFALKRRLPPDASEVGGWPALVLAAAWTAVAADVFVDAFPGTVSYPGGTSYAVLVFPFLLVAVAVLARTRPRPALTLAAAWTTLVSGALIAAIVVSSSPLLAVAIPAVLVSAVVCSRRPAGAMIVVLGLTGATNTLEAYTPIPVDNVVDLVLLGLWAGVAWSYLFSLRDRPVWIWPGIAVCLLYIAMTVGAMLGAESLMGGLRAFRSTAWYMLAFVLVAYAGWRPEVHHRMAKGFVLVAVVVGAYATLRWAIGPGDKETALALAGDGKYEVVNGEVRLFGSFSSGKELAAWTAVLIPFCLAFGLTFKGRWSVPALVAAVLCTVGLLGSEARAGFIGAVLGVALVLALYQFARGVPGLHLGITAAAVVGVAAIGVFIFSQTAGGDEDGANRYTRLVTAPTEDPSYQARIFKWETALEDIWDHPFGQGLGAAGVRSSRFYSIGSSSIDSSYLKIALEQGFAVMILFMVGLILLVLGLVKRAVLTADRHRAGLGIGAAGVLVALAALMFSGVFIIGLTALAAWVLIGLGVGQFTSPPQQPSAST